MARRLTVLVLTLVILGSTACSVASPNSSPTTSSNSSTSAGTPPTQGVALNDPGTPFASTSVWNAPLPIDTPVNPNDTDYLNVIKDDNCGEPTAVPEKPV